MEGTGEDKNSFHNLGPTLTSLTLDEESDLAKVLCK